ncbi:MAG: NDP-sugar synthase [Anaerolineae bacterium]
MNKLVGLLPAAGRGSRLGVIPCSKEIMPLGFRSHVPQDENGEVWHPVTTIEIHLRAFRAAGVERAAIIIGRSKSDIMRYLGRGRRYGLHLAYFYQERLRGMPFALDIPYSWIGQSTVLFSMPDTLITPYTSMQQLLKQHRYRHSDVTLGLFSTGTPERFGMVALEEDGRVVNFIDKPTSTTNLKYMWGYAAWSPRFTQFMHEYLLDLPPESPECVLSDVFMAALHHGLRIQPFLFEESRYHDIGTPESFQAAVYEMALQQATNEIAGEITQKDY